MAQIVSISFRELTRLRNRFSGGVSPLIVVLVLLAAGTTLLTLRQTTTLLGSGLYRVGVSGDAPAITDSRFAVVRLDPSQGQALLDKGAIDVWINGAQVVSRADEKSQYAVGALRRFLERQELLHVSEAYAAKDAFPLRLGVSYQDPGAPVPTSLSGDGAADNLKSDEVIIPSLMTPKAPFAQVIISMVFILPVTFISVFFTGSFMDEKINRRLVALLSTPATPFQIIVGKMLPYVIFSVIAILGIAYVAGANMLQALSIFLPTTLFIFAIYLMVPLFYRTFKDTTFISMFVTTLTTASLVFPAMFNGVSDFAYLSPLTLAIKMFRGEAYGWREYLFPSLPMLAVFALTVYAGTRLLNEEFLMGYRAMTTKIKEAVYLVLDRAHPYRSVAIFSFFSIPAVYVIQVVELAFASNLPQGLIVVVVLVGAALVEEVVKSVSIITLVESGRIKSWRQVLLIAFLSAAGFLAGEKFLLLFSINLVSQNALSATLMNNTGFLLVPLVAHFVFTATVTALFSKAGWRYSLALLAGVLIHSLYNWALMGGL